jgi:hypothetical protein
MTITEVEINAAKQAGRDAVNKGEACVNWEDGCDGPLGIAWVAGWNEENAKLTETEFVKFTCKTEIVRVITESDDRRLNRRYRHHALEMVFGLGEEYGWKGTLQDMCRKCTGGGRMCYPGYAKSLAEALGRALDDRLSRLDHVRSEILKEVHTMYIYPAAEPYARIELYAKYRSLTPRNIEITAMQVMETAAAGGFVVKGHWDDLPDFQSS